MSADSACTASSRSGRHASPYTVSVGITTGSPAASERRTSSIWVMDVSPRRRGPALRGRLSPRCSRRRARRGALRRALRRRPRPRARARPPTRGRRGPRARRPRSHPRRRAPARGSHSRTSGSSVSISSGRTYGGFETTRSHGPAGNPAKRSHSPSSIAIPVRTALAPATSSAAEEVSIAVTRAPGCSSAIASAIAPLPVPTSSTRGRSLPAIRTRQRSTTISVSGRGTSTRASTCSVSRRNPHSPRTYASGSRAARRSTRRCELAAPPGDDSFLDDSSASSDRDRPSTWPTRISASTRGDSHPAASRRFAVSSSDALDLHAEAAASAWRCSSARSASVRLAQVPVENLVEPVQRQLDPVIGDATLGEVVRPDLLRPLARADLRATRGRELRLLLFALELVEARAQDAHRLHAVLELRLLVLHRDDEAGRKVGDRGRRSRSCSRSVRPGRSSA